MTHSQRQRRAVKLPGIRIAREPADTATEGQRVAFAEALEGNGSSTFDVCEDCLSNHGGDGAPWPGHPELKPYNGDAEDVPCMIMVTEPPSYNDEPGEYVCAVCGCTLVDGVLVD